MGTTGLAARQAALSALCEILDRRHPLEAALSHTGGLEPRDAHFARAIVAETLRRLGQLEDLIRHFVPKPVSRHKAGPTLEILLLGACELIFLQVPAHAAVNGAVALADADAKAKHFKPLINAVLRKIATEGAVIVAAQDAARLNLPDWLWERWCETFGEETTRAIAAAHLGVPPLDLVAPHKPPAATDALFADVYRLKIPQRVDVLPGFADGDWWVQDAAASLPARLLGAVCGERVLDLCAAPGGKTAQLAAAGALVTAVERETSRLDRLKENLARLHLAAETLACDLRDLVLPPAPFVLLDAPCSATGTIRRHPDLAWIKGEADVTLCAAATAELLDKAAELTAPDGTLVFAVCSLQPEEGPEQAAAFLRTHPDFTPAPIRSEEVFGRDEWLSEGNLRTLPCHLPTQGGMDGFFAARFRKHTTEA